MTVPLFHKQRLPQTSIVSLSSKQMAILYYELGENVMYYREDSYLPFSLSAVQYP